jgi:hypothetical protein
MSSHLRPSWPFKGRRGSKAKPMMQWRPVN